MYIALRIRLSFIYTSQTHIRILKELKTLIQNVALSKKRGLFLSIYFNFISVVEVYYVRNQEILYLYKKHVRLALARK